MNDKETYWQTYFDTATVQRAAGLRRSGRVESDGVGLHVDLFEQPDAQAPVLIFNHGGGGYSRLFTPLALALFDRGYTVLLPDQLGQGLSGGSWRDLAVDKLVGNLVDVARWARTRWHGPLFMGGGSLGGGLTYHAAAAGAPVDGIICHNLYDFGRPADALALSSMPFLADLPGVPRLSALLVGALGAVLPGVPLPYRLLGRFDRMVDRRDKGFYPRWQADPVPMRRVTLGYLATLFSTPPAVAYEDNRLPVLVVNPTLDQMVAPAVTRRNYERLGGPTAYAEIPYGHWALSDAFVADWVGVVDDWIRALIPAP